MKKILLTLVGVICSLGMWADETGTMTVKWYDRSAENFSKAGTASVDDILTVSDATPSSTVTVEAKQVYNKNYYTSCAITSAGAGKNTYSLADYVVFKVTVKDDCTFTPTSVTAYMIGYGTGNNGGALSIGALSKVAASGASSMALTNSGSESSLTSPTHSLTANTTYNAGESFLVYAYVGWRNNSKNTDGIGDVVITGTYTKTASTKSASDLAIVDGKSTISLDYPDGTVTLTKGTDYTTSSTGAMTFESSNTSVATVVDGVITAQGEGTATITMSQAADANYQSGQVEYTVNVTDIRSESELEVLPDHSVTVPAGSTISMDIDGNAGLITTISSNTAVATVVGSTVTTIAPGTTTITVTDEGNQLVKPGKKTFDIIVTFARKATEVTGEFTISPANGTLTTGSPSSYLSSDGSLYMEGGMNTGSNLYSDMKNDHMKLSSTNTITLPTNYPVNTIDVIGYGNGSSDVTVTLVSADGTEIGSTGTLVNKNTIPTADAASFKLETAATESIVLKFSAEIRGYIVLNRNNQTVTMNDGGDGYHYSSYYFCAEQEISGADAYTATLDGTTLTLTKIADNIIPARTGVILRNTTGDAATLTPSYTGAAKSQGDLIGASSKEVTVSAYYASGTDAAGKIFTLGKDDTNGVGFFKFSGKTLAAKKAYLYNASISSASKIAFSFSEDIATAIENVEFVENANANIPAYNLAGQRVSAYAKGIVIQNGKKYINK